MRSGSERFALRRLGNSIDQAEHATKTHQLMRYAGRALNYVPWPRATVDGKTVAFSDGAFWSLETWLPGEHVETADRPHVKIAATALWMLHEVTHDSQCFGAFKEEAPCKAVQRRFNALQVPPATASSPPLPQCRRIEDLLPRAITNVRGIVADVVGVPVRRQPILGDLRRQDVLFSNGRVTGLVDFGAATIDSPLVDLTRLLGELAGEDETLWRAGLAAYQMQRRLSEEELALIPALDAGGVVGAGLNWLRWLADGTVRPTDQVAARLDALIARLAPIANGNLVAQRALGGPAA